MLGLVRGHSTRSISLKGLVNSCRYYSQAVDSHPDAEPTSQDGQFIESYSKYSVTTYSRPNVIFHEGKGSYLWDTTGHKYIDFMAGIAVTGLGHSDEAISEIIADQAQTLIHSSNLYHNDWTPKLAKLLVDNTKEAGGMAKVSRVFLANSGTEANEAALKFARKWGYTNGKDSKKIGLVSFKSAFHGRSMGALTVTPNPKYQAPFQPLIPGAKVGQAEDFNSLQDLITDETCGVIIEPIQGEGGVNVISTDFLVALRQQCSKVGALLIFDEIQCGLGRTGRLWAHQRLPKEAHPDILTTAKALGNGYPIGATLVTEEVEDVIQLGDHGTTYGGNPLGARIGCNVIERLSDPNLLQDVLSKSQIFVSRFQKLQSQFPKLVSGYRGEGLILGLQLTVDPSDIVNEARHHGLLVITCGTNTLRFVPALNIPDSVINQGLDILETVLADTNSKL